MKWKSLLAALCAAGCLTTSAQALSTSAASAVLMDAQSGRVLYAQNAHQSRSIASVTKLMTALVAVEEAPDLDAVVTVDPTAVGVEGSSIYLKRDERLTLRELLYGLLLQSGNDAAVAIAIACAGSVDAFVDKMNEKAAALGMTGSHFANPNGLEQEGHWSTAYDMALLAQAVLADPDLAAIAATKSIRIGERQLTNHNKLLWRYEGCIGLKTGYTQKAGRTLVSAAARDGLTLIAVTLSDPDDWNDHTAMLDYGFRGWGNRLLARGDKTIAMVAVSGSLVRAVPVATVQEVRACLASDEAVTAHLDLPGRLEAPVSRGDVVGAITFYLNGNPIGKTDLVAAADAPGDRQPCLPGLLGGLPLPGTATLYRTLPLWRGTPCQNPIV